MSTNDSGAALAHERILNADVASFRILLVNKALLAVFHQHGLKHYQTVGRPHDVIEVGHVLIMEGWEKKGLKELFGTAQATINDWAAHISLFRMEDLDYHGWERILCALPETQVKEIAGFELLPKGVRKFVKKFAKGIIENEVTYDALGIARDAKESTRTIASLELVVAYVNENEGASMPECGKRDFTADSIQNRLQVADVKASAFPHGWHMPDAASIEACLKTAKEYGIELEDGDDKLPAAAQSLLKGKDKKRASFKRDNSGADEQPGGAPPAKKAKQSSATKAKKSSAKGNKKTTVIDLDDDESDGPD